ncbi:hypothetical protein H6F88_04675 [Oculatella sp. FACHB-28]|uniref:hypothetical protein n=1 Tax=Oculatella sp. FACHB-28 TaxID=2692845 RepID=UPI001685FB02|nr:hypothetical protein [Oculatella sp. FACHB-28]MBD2055325.1 hypothetical protein [Oculatella sp. FACHB-28]
MIVYPPYGQFARIYKESVDPASLAPNAWRPALPQFEREQTWLEWRNETIKLINETLWPQWDQTASAWFNPDHNRMHALTTADFELFSTIDGPAVLDQRPDTPVAAASIPTHRQYFVDEDTAKLGDRYFFYDVTLPSQQLDKLPSDLRQALKDKAGSVSIQIKQLLQRPRAYQVAKLIGQEHRFELAATSMTSSMSSGHCFQGCLAAAGIYEAWLQRGYAPTESQLAALGQFGVDIGDRRVFAGVHYPSDNLSSWIMDLRLLPEVCADKRVSRFVADAITKRSFVYRSIVASRKAAYSDALALVQSLAKAAG